MDRLSDGHPQQELIEALEPDQIVAAASRPLPRYVMSRKVRLALYALRIFALLTAGLVLYTFAPGLKGL